MTPRIFRRIYRRKPPNRVLAVLVVLSCLSFTASAQLVQPLSVPSSSTFTLQSTETGYFELPTLPSASLYLTLSVCTPPDSISSAPLPSHLNTTLYVSTTSDIQYPGPDNVPSKAQGEGATSKLTFGAANVTLPLEDGPWDGVWVGVSAPDDAELYGPGGGTWTFELDVTSDEPTVLLDGGASFDFKDSDQSSALLATANWTDGEPQPSTYQPAYFPVIAPATPLSYSLGRSKCFVTSQNSIPARNINSSATTRGYGGGTRTQFALANLPPGTNYTAWLVQNLTEISPTVNATRIWDPIFFTTKSTSSCRLLYDLDFCPSVAYSVPVPLSLPTPDLIDHFNSTISPALAAFARTLTTFPCNSTQFGQYSVVSSCEDCYEAYRDWVCATTIPRCTDAPENVTDIVSNSSRFDPSTSLATWSIPSSYETLLVRDYPPASRTPSFAPLNLSTTFPSLFNSSYPSNRQHTFEQTPFPYSEVPPCMDVCSLVDARCPPFLGWTCPTSGGGTGKACYGTTEPVGGQERVAGDVRHSSRTERAQDRWGNIYCNALGSDLKMAAQFVSFSASSTASPSSRSTSSPSSLFGSILPTFVLLLSGLYWH